MSDLYVYTVDGRYINIAGSVPIPITDEDRKATKQRTTEYRKKFEDEKERNRVPENPYHFQTIKKIYKKLGYKLVPIYGGYKATRYVSRQRYDIVENFGEHKVAAENLDYYQLGKVLELIGAWDDDSDAE